VSKRCALRAEAVLPIVAARLVLALELGCAPRSIRSPTTWDEVDVMLFTIAVVLLVLWLMGFVAFHVTTGFIHLLLLAAVIAVVFQLVSGRRTI
jgi:hypothetical protein